MTATAAYALPSAPKAECRKPVITPPANAAPSSFTRRVPPPRPPPQPPHCHPKPKCKPGLPPKTAPAPCAPITPTTHQANYKAVSNTAIWTQAATASPTAKPPPPSITTTPPGNYCKPPPPPAASAYSLTTDWAAPSAAKTHWAKPPPSPIKTTLTKAPYNRPTASSPTQRLMRQDGCFPSPKKARQHPAPRLAPRLAPPTTPTTTPTNYA